MKLISTYCGAIIEVPDEENEPVPEFILALAPGAKSSAGFGIKGAD
jgi:hypothetical protein